MLTIWLGFLSQVNGTKAQQVNWSLLSERVCVGINPLPNGFTVFSVVPPAALSECSPEGWRGEVNDKVLFSMPGSFLLCCKVSQGWHVFHVCLSLLSHQHFYVCVTLARPLTSLVLFNLTCRKGHLRTLQVELGAGRRSAAAGTICHSFVAPLAFQLLQKGPDLIQTAPLYHGPGGMPALPALSSVLSLSLQPSSGGGSMALALVSAHPDRMMDGSSCRRKLGLG